MLDTPVDLQNQGYGKQSQIYKLKCVVHYKHLHVTGAILSLTVMELVELMLLG